MKIRNHKDNYVVGVDGGASKSVAVLMSRDGKIQKERRGKPINYHTEGERGVEKHLKELIRPFFRAYIVRAAAFGFAGLNTEKEHAVYRRIVAKCIPRSLPHRIVNDTKTALQDACPQENVPRILVIAGTGSHIYGEYRGKSAHSGGWDFLFGDEGSAYGFGLSAIRSSLRSFDKRGKKTILETLVKTHARVEKLPFLTSTVYDMWLSHPGSVKRFIASFSKLVDVAARKNDPIAREIIREGAHELFLGARAVIDTLGVRYKEICVGYVGSNFKSPGLRTQLSRHIRKYAPHAEFMYEVYPARGAGKLALLLGGTRTHRE